MSVWCSLNVLSNIWSAIHEEVKEHWGWVEKKTVAYEKDTRGAPLSMITW